MKSEAISIAASDSGADVFQRIRAGNGTFVASAAAVMALLKWLHEELGKTLIMVTHDPAQARLGTRMVSLFDGRVVEESLEVA